MSYSARSAPLRRHEAPLSFARVCAILAVFTVVLTFGGTDMTKVAAALPELTERLSLTPLQALWTADAYALTTGVAIIPSAVLADRYGRKRAYTAGLCVALVSAVIAGAATGSAMLIAGRIGQGIGSALLIAATVAIIRVSFPTLRSRSVAYGLWVASFSAGTGLGPLLGGVLLEELSWNWIFWINAPVLGLSLIAASLVLPESRNTTPPRLDPLSIASSTVGLGALILALKVITRDDLPAAAPALLIGGATAGVVFCWRQTRLRRPYLDITLFKNSVLSVSALSIVATSGLFNGTLYLLTQQLLSEDTHTAISAGVALLPLAAASMAGGILAPQLTRWIAEPHLLTAGFLSTSLGSLLVISLPQTPHPLSLILLGLGAGTVMALASNALMSSAPTTRTADAGAIQESSFALGGGIGIAALGVIALHYSAGQEGDLATGAHTALGAGAFLYSTFGIGAALMALGQQRSVHRR